jgi:dinuclear metal center YbgI/SA1388 family protein
MEIEPELVFGFLDEYLGIPDFPDYGPAWNGLQVEGEGAIHKVGAAVDAGQAVVDAAAGAGLDLLLVHHGLFWGGSAPLTGRLHRKVASLVRSGTALYSAHLPLDAHPEVGNAAVLTRALGLDPGERFGRFEGVEVGFVAETHEDRDELRERVAGVVDGPVRLIPGGPEQVRRVGVVTGGGGGFIREAAEAGLDALLTGEGAHHTYLDAMELGVNVLYAGHYATETWGVRALAGKLEAEFGLPWEFLDFPSGL